VPKKRVGLGVLGVVGSLIAGLSALIYNSYQKDISRARERISSRSQIVETPCGPIEFAVAGDGPPVLMVHGAGGGYDQGIGFAQPLVDRGFRVIATSRFGYLRTPLPADASAEAQAEAHACLLDALNITKAAILGASAGAPSSMQFALKYPERCSALVLLVPAAYAPRPAREPTESPVLLEVLFNTVLQSDFLFWLATKTMRSTMIKTILATPPEVVEEAGVEERARVAEMLRNILPVSQRQQGLRNDAAVTSSLSRYGLERITVPSLVISVADDLFGTFESARYTAQHVPNARFVGYESGGHLWVGHHQEVLAEIVAFLKQQTDGNVSSQSLH
jgi:2-hydroxy-6-oxonona-2,4-dienedioate hydrolase